MMNAKAKVQKEILTLNGNNSVFGFTHKCGILMPISSLPNEYGIGSFGKCAYEFVDFLARCSQTCWQVLPLNPTSYGDSPYQSPASVAGNPYFIDLDILAEKGLLTSEELAGERCTGERVDYGRLFNTRYKVLRLAHSRFVEDGAYRTFCEKNADWLGDYALFMALKVHYGYAAWTSWESCHRDVLQARRLADGFAAECDFWKWVQYEFFTEWDALHSYARSAGILIIGDMPIYVAHDSMDVWRAPEQFLLDGEYMPTVVAGCPPDAYAEDGQRWGNPIYNWEKMENEDFAWWVGRAGRAFSLYDFLRIDHFRGFASYYSIDASCDTAREGSWQDAPGKKLFDKIKSVYPSGRIIAEDLGYITDDVRELLAYTSFPGMKVIQFAFYGADSEYLPRCYTTDNCIAYVSTHDSDCTRSWFDSLDSGAKARFDLECSRCGRQTPTSACIDLAMGSRAELCIVCMQDYLELTSEEGRMNIPSKPDGNWSWRIKPGYNTDKLRRRIRAHTLRAGRQK